MPEKGGLRCDWPGQGVAEGEALLVTPIRLLPPRATSSTAHVARPLRLPYFVGTNVDGITAGNRLPWAGSMLP